MNKQLSYLLLTTIILGGYFDLSAQGELLGKDEKKNGSTNSTNKAEENKINTEIDRLRKERDMLELQNSIEREKLKIELNKLLRDIEKLTYENNLNKEKFQIEQYNSMVERNHLENEMQKLKFEKAQMDIKAFRKEALLTNLELDLIQRRKKREWDKEVNASMKYPLNPVKNNSIEISDRRINMNEVITYALADHITERIAFYNNKSEEQPIFLVIDMCPGGSVIAGHKIIKAIENSQAPVYVVVKSYAASMAAIIVATAKHSYAYPNSIILHHQMSGFNLGNLTQQKERLAMAQEWMRRLYQPVAKKMGVSLDEMVKTMYTKNSDGDWQEFADNAVKLNWLTGLVDDIREKSVVKLEEPAPKLLPFFFQAEEKMDAQGHRYITLPVLSRHDFYFMDNKDNYYRH